MNNSIKYLLLSLDNLLECIGHLDPNVLKKIREGASLSDLNFEYNLHLSSWEQRISPLLSKFVNDLDIMAENQRLKQDIERLKQYNENTYYNLNDEIFRLKEKIEILEKSSNDLSWVATCLSDFD